MKIALNHERRVASRVVKALGICALVAAAMGCAKPTSMRPGMKTPEVEAARRGQLVLFARGHARDRARVFRIGYPLLVAAAPDCPEDQAEAVGLDLAKLTALSPVQREAAESVLMTSLDGAPSSGLLVTGVAGGSPAERAGLVAGDVVTAAFDRAGAPIDLAKAEAPGFEPDKPFGLPGLAPVRVERWRSAVLAERLRQAAVLESSEAAAPPKAETAVEPHRAQASVTLSPETVCSYPFMLNEQEVANAFADGERVSFSRGMLHFAQDDIELATVIAHEIAHNQRGHIDDKKTNAAIGAIGGGALDIAIAVLGVNTGGAFSKSFSQVGASAYSQEFEAEADYVALYLMRRAGYDTAQAANIWRRFGATSGAAAITGSGSHPTTPERFVLMTRTHEEIVAKEAAGQPLTPNEAPKSDWSPQPSSVDQADDSAFR